MLLPSLTLRVKSGNPLPPPGPADGTSPTENLTFVDYLDAVQRCDSAELGDIGGRSVEDAAKTRNPVERES